MTPTITDTLAEPDEKIGLALSVYGREMQDLGLVTGTVTDVP